MATLSDSDRKAYELYLLASTEEERQEAIKKLIPGSYLYYHLYFLDRLKTVGSKLTEEDQRVLQQFRKKYPYEKELTQIETRLKLLEYDDATTDEQRQALLNEINFKYVHASFDHVKPEEISRSAFGGAESSQESDSEGFGGFKKSSTFAYDDYFSRDKILERCKGFVDDQYRSSEGLRMIPVGYEQEIIDFKEYHPQTVYEWAQNSGRVSDLNNPTFYEALKSAFEENYKNNKHFTLDQSFCNTLTLAQLDRVSQLHPNIKDDEVFIGSYFKKHFNEELSKENQQVWSNDEKRANLLQLYNYTKLKNMPKSLQSALLIEVLELGIKLGIYDEKLFREYLQMPMVNQPVVFKGERAYQGSAHWNQYLKNVQTQSNNQGQWHNTQSDLINKYLEHFCQASKGSLEAFKEDFQKEFLAKIEERVAIYNSDDMTELSVDLKKYQQICNEVALRFLESNQENFRVDEEVKIQLELKNIQTLYVKIFEFNTETYYKKTLQPFNTGVNLDGLVASNEKVFEYKNPSNKKFIETFAFPELNGKVGLFIVEFIGNGMSSRAVVKKGSLSLIHKPTIAGHLAYVLDENKQICKGPRTGIYFDGQYYETTPESNGKIFIPYGKSTLQAKAIMINNGFAQLVDFERQTENYSFSAWIHIDSESILTGMKACAIIKPNLTINGRFASVEVLKNTKVTLTTTNYTDGIPVTKTFDNVKFANNRELVVDFQVPPYLQSIVVNIETELYNITQQSNQKFNASKTFSIQTHHNSKNMSELFLRREQGSYILHVLGKNGEPRPHVNVAISLMHKYFKEQETNVHLQTDKDGRINLGTLKKIFGIRAHVQLFNIEQTWVLNLFKESLTYPNAVDVVENEIVEFPVSFKSKSRKYVSLIKITKNRVLEDVYDKIEFIQQADKDYNLIKIKNLADGKYTLNFKKEGKQISIIVNRGQYWDNDTFILKRNLLFENQAAQKMIKIASVKVEESKQAGQQDIKIKLEDFTKNTRVHVYACQFMPNASLVQFFSLYQLIASQVQSKIVFPFANWKNIYLSNRELGDEFRYVFDRKYAERFLGNTLERPKLLLKRQFVQETQINQEALKSGDQFQQNYMQQEIQQNYQMRSQNIQQKSSMIPHAKMFRKMAGGPRRSYGHDQEEVYGYDGMVRNFSDSSEMQKISEFQNFLKNQPFTAFNLIPNQDGQINFTANLSHYSQMIVLAVDTKSVAQREIDLSVNAIQKRDLSLKQALDSAKGFTESRTTVEILKNEAHLIEDISSTDIQLIDDLKKVKGVLQELMRNNYQLNQAGPFKEYSETFLKWNKMDEEEKIKNYYKLLCHEINLFIYFKDRAFFDKIVRPFLSNKMEKQFIDLYLLGEYAKIIHFAKIENIQRLNVLEQCLLVDALVKSGKSEDAKRVASFIGLQRDISEYQDLNDYNRKFDIVLNLNMLKGSGAGADGANPFADALNMDQIVSQSNSIQNQAFGAFGEAQMQQQAVFSNFANYSQVPVQALGGAFGFGNVQQQQYQQTTGSLFGSAPRAMPQMAYAHPQMDMFVQQNVAPMSYSMNSNVCMSRNTPDLFDDIQVNDVYQEAKKQVKVKFEEIQSTGEYMETHYYKQTSYSHSRGLISYNSFWVDYANYLASAEHKSFLSPNFIRSADNQISALLTMALIDLPFEAESHNYKTNEGRGVEIKTAGNVILFKKEVREAPVELTNDILVTHRYIIADSNSDQSSAVPDEFLANKPYSCEVIITNVSPQQKEFAILYQIPQGSLPLEMTKYIKSINMNLMPYTTQKQIFHFYFPCEGKFEHFPSSAAIGQKVTAKANAHTLNVVRKLSVNKKESFMDILQSGNKEDILDFLRKYNLLKGEKGFSAYNMLWMLKDKAFFKKVIEILRDRFIFISEIWQHGFYHRDDEQVCREYLEQTKPYNLYQNGLGTPTEFVTKLVNVKAEDDEFKHLDYYPMINARAHTVGELEHWTLNKNLKDTYEKFLRVMVSKKSLSPADKLQFVYYLQLQDRITEAITLFKTIDISQEVSETLRMQHDYMNAYFDFFTGQAEGFKVARSIVRKYEDYPIMAWRILFLEILDQLNEYDGEIDESLDNIDPENLTEEQKKQKYKQSVKREPRLACEISNESQKIIIESANIKALAIKFYIIDVEILFSRTPFLKENTEEFSYVKPCHVMEKELNIQDLNSSVDTTTFLQTEQKLEIPIPEHLKNQNMVIEVTGDGSKQIFKTYYSSQIKVNVIEAYGELKVTDKEGNPLPKVYVKVFQQKKDQSSGQAAFFKDGYTDIRGKFEYAQTSGKQLGNVQKFAILVMSDNLGSVIKECEPPKNMGGDSGSSSDGRTQFAQKKEERIMNRWNASKNAVSKCKK